jgi:ABC-type antimicrobial peptide transport system permease subunit
MVHSELPARRLRPLVESTITQVAPGIPLSEVSSLSERIEGTIAEQRLFAQTITMLTLLAVGLAGVGLYGLVGFAVAERTREFGIRIALGAQHQQVLNMVIHEGAFLAVFGVGLGLVGAVVLSRLIASRLYGVTPLEPFVYIMSISLLVLITLLASFVPARAATKVDPMVALRSE